MGRPKLQRSQTVRLGEWPQLKRRQAGKTTPEIGQQNRAGPWRHRGRNEQLSRAVGELITECKQGKLPGFLPENRVQVIQTDDAPPGKTIQHRRPMLRQRCKRQIGSLLPRAFTNGLQQVRLARRGGAPDPGAVTVSIRNSLEGSNQRLIARRQKAREHGVIGKTERQRELRHGDPSAPVGNLDDRLGMLLQITVEREAHQYRQYGSGG